MKTYSRKKTDEVQEVIIHLNELCRLCMAKDEELVPIFNDEDAIPLTLRIMACVSLEVFEGDGLPSMICHPCRFQLEKSYAFKKKCENSDLKLRQHLKLIREKMGNEVDEPMEAEDGESAAAVTETIKESQKSDSAVNQLLEDLMGDGEDSVKESSIEETSIANEPATEQDLLGVAQLAYIQPDVEPVEEEQPESITLPLETEHMNKEACTLNNSQLKKEVLEAEEDDQEDQEEDCNLYVMAEDDEQQDQNEDALVDDQDLNTIANAVKATLSQHPEINISGELQMKVNQIPGQPTQVQVTTEDGSIVIMELMTEEEPMLNDPNNEDDEIKVFKCPDCPKAFSRRIQLRRHSSVHMQQRGFSCGICEKWFPTRSALIRHERIHTGERPFQCDVCQKSFAQKEILYRHLMTHTGQKPYNCTHCPKGFTQKEPLRIHMRSHLEPNPNDIQLHHCTLCPKVFCHASGLSRHLVTHTGKTFKCRGCDKSFTDKSSLRRHHRQTQHQS